MIFFETILRILFPKRCVSCGVRNDRGLCAVCLKSISVLSSNKHTDIISAFSYKNPVIKKILWECKFNGDCEPLRLIMDTVYDVFIDEMTDRNIFNNFQNPLLVPIPLHKKRRKKRGFNQSEIIARELHTRNPETFVLEEKSLIRSRATHPQAQIANKQERLKNVEHCFQVTQSEIFFNKNIIIIDDIATTGATVREAMKVLKKAGARNVYVFTIAQ